MVLRSIPVTRSISRWLRRAASSVAIVVCKCGFKTFTPVPLFEGMQGNVLPATGGRLAAGAFSASSRRGQVG
jgi:hypothetical protein